MNKILLQLIGFTIILTVTSCKENVDILIKQGQLVDGKNYDSQILDIAIKDDKIYMIGEKLSFNAKYEIDASDLIVSPGFIDVHSHAGRGLVHADRSDAKALLTQGLTSVIINPDGGGSIDLNEQDSLLMKDGLGINVMQMVPHGSIRRAVMGMEARFANEEELEQMKEFVLREMNKGAFGLSSGPFYTPGSYSDTRELVELAKVIEPFKGIYTSHIRDESNYTIGLEDAVEEVITIAREAGVTGIVTHIKALGPPVWGMSETIIKNINNAREAGINVYADQYPYNASATGLSSALLPRWSQAGGHDSFMERLEHADTLNMIRIAMEDNLKRRGGPERIQFRYFEADNSIQGKNLRQVSSEKNLDPISTALEMIKTGKPIGIVSFNMDDGDVYNFMKQEWTMTCSDGAYPQWGSGVPHPRSFGSFPRKIRKYVIEDSIVSLNDAIRSMTTLPSEVFGIDDRGKLEVGAIADIVIFDINDLTDKATFTDPFQYSEGIIYSIVNGQLAIDQGQFQGILAGKIVKKPTQ